MSAILVFFLRVNCHTCHIWKRVVYQDLKYHSLPNMARVVFEINSARFDQSAFRNFSACIISYLILYPDLLTVSGKIYFDQVSIISSLHSPENGFGRVRTPVRDTKKSWWLINMILFTTCYIL